MVGPSLNTHNLSLKPNAAAVKFLCSYGGKILPRYPDGMLRYHGGQTRVLAVDRSISFSGDEPDLSISQDGSKKEGPEESGDSASDSFIQQLRGEEVLHRGMAIVLP